MRCPGPYLLLRSQMGTDGDFICVTDSKLEGVWEESITGVAAQFSPECELVWLWVSG